MVVYHEALPTGYLLALAPSAATNETELADHLARACYSGKPAVWVDCRLLDTFSTTAVWLLWACHLRLRRRRVPLVLCQVSERAARKLRRTLASVGSGPQLAPTLNHAATLAPE